MIYKHLYALCDVSITNFRHNLCLLPVRAVEANMLMDNRDLTFKNVGYSPKSQIFKAS